MPAWLPAWLKGSNYDFSDIGVSASFQTSIANHELKRFKTNQESQKQP